MKIRHPLPNLSRPSEILLPRVLRKNTPLPLPLPTHVFPIRATNTKQWSKRRHYKSDQFNLCDKDNIFNVPIKTLKCFDGTWFPPLLNANVIPRCTSELSKHDSPCKKMNKNFEENLSHGITKILFGSQKLVHNRVID